jgi:hypothetical protein
MGCVQPKLDDATVFDLGKPRYHVTFLPRTAHAPQLGQHKGILNAMSVAADFKKVAESAAGCCSNASFDRAGGRVTSMPNSAHSSKEEKEGGSIYGPWRPFLASVLANRRLTAEDHFQDVR